MAVASESSTIGDHLKWRKPRKHPISTTRTATTDPIPNPNIPSIIQSTRCKSTISSLLLSSFTTTTNNNNPESSDNRNNKKGFIKTSSLRGFGCTAQPEVSVPAIIRSSAQWDEERESKNKKKSKKKKKKQIQGKMMREREREREESIGVQDLWCGPGIGSDAAATSVDCVVSGRPLSGRGKIDLNKVHHSRERTSYSSRQRVNAEHFASLEPDSAFEFPHFGVDSFEERYYHHLRNRSPEGLAEIMMFQNGLLMGRRPGGLDRYRDWRLDVDNMTYEELLELGERIGYVNTGLGEDQIGRCLRKTKLSVVNEVSSKPNNPVDEVEGKCSICQEEYESEDEVGKLECGHAYHLRCIKQWLARKNACPVCKVEASSK